MNSRLSPRSGSETAHRQAAIDRADAGVNTVNAMLDGPQSGFMGSIKSAVESMGLDEQTATLVAQRLTSRPDSVEAIQELIDAGRITEDLGAAILESLTAGNVVRAATATASPLVGHTLE